MSEELPGRSTAFVATMIAASLRPSRVHPKHAVIPNFPITLKPEDEREILGALEAVALRHLRA
jgi:hypothetical protein